MKKTGWIVSILIIAVTQIQAADFEPAKLIENLNSQNVKETPSYSRMEGWVFLSYMVGKDGLPQRVELIASSNSDKYLEASMRHLNNFRFSPARYQNKNVLSAKTFFIKHDKSFYGMTNDGISSRFREKYNEADNLLSSKKFDQAKNILDEITEDFAKNLTEQALNAWLHAHYFLSQQNWTSYGDSVLTAHLLREHLPTKMAIRNTQNLLEWQKYQKEYSDAMYTLNGMRNIKSATLDKVTYQAMLKPIVSALKDTSVNEITTILAENRVWMHSLPRPIISLKVIDGEVDWVELRCENGLHRFESAKIEKFLIPADYLKCAALVKGMPGTKIRFVEEGEIRAF